MSHRAKVELHLATSISILILTFFKPAPATTGFNIDCRKSASAIRSRARYVTLVARVCDYSTGNEVRRYTRGYPREKSIHDPPVLRFKRAPIHFYYCSNFTFRRKRRSPCFLSLKNSYVCVDTHAHVDAYTSRRPQLIPIV